MCGFSEFSVMLVKVRSAYFTDRRPRRIAVNLIRNSEGSYWIVTSDPGPAMTIAGDSRAWLLAARIAFGFSSSPVRSRCLVKRAASDRAIFPAFNQRRIHIRLAPTLCKFFWRAIVILFGVAPLNIVSERPPRGGSIRSEERVARGPVSVQLYVRIVTQAL